MKELALRAFSGAVYVALVLGAAWLGPVAIYVLFLPITVLAVLEWHRLYWRGQVTTFTKGASSFIAVMAYALGIACEWPSWAPWLWAGLGIALIIEVVLSPSKGRAALFGISLVLYIALPMASACWLTSHGAMVFAGFMLLLWTNDTGAYLVGKSIGRNKLMPKVSPGKTWEGLLAGIALTALVAWLLSGHFSVLSKPAWLVAAVAVSVTATIGDLLESYMKRRAGVKDSGTIMPGHGGVLDRFDGYLLAAPVMVLIVYLLH